MAIERFEDIQAWQKARSLTRDIYRETRQEPCVRDFRFASQIQSASVSIMSNIAEGFERKQTKQFAQCLNFAKASCAEVRSLLYVALDVEYFDKSTFRALMDKANEIGRMISGFRKALRGSATSTRNSDPGTRNSGEARG